MSILSSFDLMQHVTQPTHRGKHILDLLISKNGDGLVVGCTVKDSGFPDHFAILAHLSLDKPPLPTKTVSYRKLKDVSTAELNDAIRSTSLLSCDINAMPLDALTRLYDSELSHALNNVAPLRSRTIVIRPESKWYNNEIRVAKQQRRRSENKWRKSGLAIHREIYMSERQKVNDMIKDAKATYFREMISTHQKNTKQLFGVINDLLGKTRDNPLPPGPKKEDVAEMFGQFFVEKIDLIKASIPVADIDSLNLTFPQVAENFEAFQAISMDDIRTIITESPNKSCSLDPLPTHLTRAALDVLLPVIHVIVNRSLSEGHFPQCYKEASVTPLLKKTTLPPECKNYRPISNLRFLSKILEKIVTRQLNQHLQINGILEPFQSAYRQSHSCETALLRVQNDIVLAVSEKKVVLLVLLDLTAAFDTVNHKTLLQILERLGVRGTTLHWFTSYLHDRSQSVKIGGASSEPKHLSCGVPQGSVLGPILFTLYTSSLGTLIRRHLPGYHFYADDTQLYVSAEPQDLPHVIHQMERCIAEVTSWLCCHELKVNELKTEFMLICSKQTRVHLDAHT